MQHKLSLTTGLVSAAILLVASDTMFAQVQGNSITEGVRVGSQLQSRGSSMMGRFNMFSTSLHNIVQLPRRASSDLLSVRTSANMRRPMSGVTGLGGPGSRPRPTNTGLITPRRPTIFNTMLSSNPNRSIRGISPRSRSAIFMPNKKIIPIHHKISPLITNRVNLLDPAATQKKSEIGSFLSKNSLFQGNNLSNNTSIAQTGSARQNLLLSQNQTIYDIARTGQNVKQTKKSIFGF